MQVDFIHGDPSRPEFGDMFGGWLTEHAGRTFLIDCGVGSGGPTLVRRLKERLGGRPLDYVLLTHIHLDHAGGLADIFKAWPETLAVVHEKGRAHLARPERLWAGTREVMGELADMYGRPEPVDPARLLPHPEARLPGVEIFETPGHAVHHLSFRLGGTFFLGEAGGCPYYSGGRLFSRPATPPRYFPDLLAATLEKLLAEPDGPAYVGHTHEMIPGRECLRLYRSQLAFWDEFVRRPESARRIDEDPAGHLDRLIGRLFQEDPNLAPLNALPPPARWRERYFMRNSLEGFVRHYEDQARESA